MNEGSAINSPTPSHRAGWLEQYLPSDASGAASSNNSQLIDVTAVRGMLFRQRWVIIGLVALSLMIGLILTVIQQPIYQANATLRIEPRGLSVVDGQDVSPQVFNNEISSYMSTQVGVIESYNLAKVVAEGLNANALAALLGSDIDSTRPQGLSNEEWQTEKQAIAASALQGGISADIPYDSRIATISFQSSDPVLAAKITTAYAEAYVSADTRRDLASNAYAQTYLQEQIADVRGRLQDAEKAANAYARQNGIVIQSNIASDDDGQPTTITASSLASVNQAVGSARANRIAAEQRWRAVSAIAPERLPEVQESPVIQGLQTAKAELVAQRADLRQRYEERYPKIAEVNARIAVIDRQIASTSADIKSSIRSNFTIALQQERALSKELQSVTRETLDEQDLQIQFGVLDREADALRTQLADLLSRFNAISTAANVQSGSITILDPAKIPGAPVSPNLWRNLLIALIGGLGLAGGVAALRETFDDRLRSIEDIEAKFGLPLLGHTPYVDEKDIDEQEADQSSGLMEAYASIRSTIDYAVSREQNVLQLTSSQPGEGKSTTALLLSQLFAQMGRKTLLIDADLRKPSIAKLVGSEPPKVGLVEVLRGHCDFASAVMASEIDNLDILPIANLPPNPVEMLSSDHFKKLIEAQRQEYSLILIDSSPVMGIADAPMLAQNVDGTIFVLEANQVQFGQAKAAIRRLNGNGANLIGIVLTKYRALTAGQGYDYQYRYYDYGDN